MAQPNDIYAALLDYVTGNTTEIQASDKYSPAEYEQFFQSMNDVGRGSHNWGILTHTYDIIRARNGRSHKWSIGDNLLWVDKFLQYDKEKGWYAHEAWSGIYMRYVVYALLAIKKMRYTPVLLPDWFRYYIFTAALMTSDKPQATLEDRFLPAYSMFGPGVKEAHKPPKSMYEYSTANPGLRSWSSDKEGLNKFLMSDMTTATMVRNVVLKKDPGVSDYFTDDERMQIQLCVSGDLTAFKYCSQEARKTGYYTNYPMYIARGRSWVLCAILRVHHTSSTAASCAKLLISNGAWNDVYVLVPEKGGRGGGTDPDVQPWTAHLQEGEYISCRRDDKTLPEVRMAIPSDITAWMRTDIVVEEPKVPTVYPDPVRIVELLPQAGLGVAASGTGHFGYLDRVEGRDDLFVTRKSNGSTTWSSEILQYKVGGLYLVSETGYKDGVPGNVRTFWDYSSDTPGVLFIPDVIEKGNDNPRRVLGRLVEESYIEGTGPYRPDGTALEPGSVQHDKVDVEARYTWKQHSSDTLPADYAIVKDDYMGWGDIEKRNHEQYYWNFKYASYKWSSWKNGVFDRKGEATTTVPISGPMLVYGMDPVDLQLKWFPTIGWNNLVPENKKSAVFPLPIKKKKSAWDKFLDWLKGLF